MGVVCGKPSRVVKDSEESTKHRELNRNKSEICAISSRREESFRVKKRLDCGEIRANLIDKKANGSRRVRDDHYEKEIENSITGLNNFSRIFSLPKAAEGEQVAAGWPSWFAQYAGEAIKGWIPRKADTFEKLDKIGQGTYSSVYKAKDLKHDKLVALKRVRFDSMDPESVKFMAREILILRRLDHQNIIKLEGLVTSRASSSLYLVFEYMEHDLTGLASLPGVKFTEPQIKCYMQQLLSGLHHCHSRGVLHRDIKGSNLLIDNNGILKIADFGLASFFDHRQRIPLTSRVVTLWYRPPELLLGASHYGVAVDLWSAGCILGELYTGKPIMPGKTEVEQLHKIFKLCGSPSENYWRKEKLLHSALFKPQQPYRRRVAETFRDLPAAALGLLETLLSIDPADRGTAANALKSEFFTTEPYACDPSSLPKYPPSKEIDAKIREEEARRQGALGNGQKGDYESRRSKELHAVPAPEANAEPALSMQRRQGHPKTNSRNELFNPQRHQAASGFPFDPPRPSQATSKDPPEQPPRRITHSGPLAPVVGWIKSGKKFDDISITSTRADFSSLSGLAVPRALLSEDSRNDLGAVHLEVSEQEGRLLQSFQEPVRKQDQKHQGQHFAGSHQIESGRTNPRRLLSHGRGWKANKIHFSGPIMGPLNNMDEMLKERDRKIQEAARRARQEKTRRGMQITANPVSSAVMEQGK